MLLLCRPPAKELKHVEPHTHENDDSKDSCTNTMRMFFTHSVAHRILRTTKGYKAYGWWQRAAKIQQPNAVHHQQQYTSALLSRSVKNAEEKCKANSRSFTENDNGISSPIFSLAHSFVCSYFSIRSHRHQTLPNIIS